MAYLTESEVIARAAKVPRQIYKSEASISTEASSLADEFFDVFLSHSSAEPEVILRGVKAMLEDYGLSVYVDKYNDPQLSPGHVTPETAEILRNRMRHSNSLLYVYSKHSQRSRWMPWELGFFDGLKGSIGIIPITQNQEEFYRGEEYLNLYPYVDIARIHGSTTQKLWINKSSKEYAELSKWANGSETIRAR